MVDARGWREEGNEELFNEYSISLMQKAKVLEISCTTMHIFNTVHLKIVKVNLCYVFFYHNKGEKNKMDYNCHQKKEKFKSQLAEAK